MKKYKIKSYIGRTIKNFGKLFVFACLLLPSFAICCLLGSWTNDDGIYTNATNFTDTNISLTFNGIDDFYIDEVTNVYVNFGIDFDGVTIPDSFIIDKSLNYNANIECNYLVINGLTNIETSIYDYLDISISYNYANTNYTDYYCSTYFFHNLIDENLLDTNTPYYNIFSIFNDTVVIPLVYNGNANFTPYFIRAEFSFNSYLMSNTSGIGANGLNNANFYVNAYTELPNLVELPYTLYSDDVYNGLDEEYMDYMESHSHSNEEYDSLQENYYTLEDDYEYYVSNHSYTNEEYNHLQDVLNDTQAMYIEARNYYDDLKGEYDALSEQYNSLANLLDSSIYSLSLVQYVSSDTLASNYNIIHTFSDISSFIVSNSYLDINSIISYCLSNNIDISNVNGFIINSTVDLSINAYNIIFNALSSPYYYIGVYYSIDNSSSQFVSYPLRIYNNLSDSYSYSIDNSLFDILSTQGFDYLFSDFTYNKIAIHFTNSSFLTNTIRNIKLNSANGYNTGYSKGLLDSANAISSLQTELKDLENQKIALNDRIKTLQLQLDNNLGWHSLFFSMADTPIKVVSGFLDYEILGINLFKALLGILTALAVIWLIKHFTR